MMLAKGGYIQQLKNRLSVTNPYLILIFGLYGYRRPNVDSDIDFLVITNDIFIPKNFKE